MSLCIFQTRVALAGRSILLVMDNCEHVADAAASGANMLLEGAPELHVLAGSLDRSTCLDLEATSAQRGFGEAWGRGLLLALDLQRPVGSQIVATLMQNGLLINSPRPDSLRYTPALAEAVGSGPDAGDPGGDLGSHSLLKERLLEVCCEAAVSACSG